MSQLQPQVVPMLTSVTAAGTTVSNGVGINSAGRLSIMVAAAAVTAGNGVFSVDVSNDPAVGWVTYNRLTTNVTNTNAQTDLRAASLTLSSNTTNFLFFPPGDTFAYMRCRVVVTTDGSYSAVAYID